MDTTSPDYDSQDLANVIANGSQSDIQATEAQAYQQQQAQIPSSTGSTGNWFAGLTNTFTSLVSAAAPAVSSYTALQNAINGTAAPAPAASTGAAPAQSSASSYLPLILAAVAGVLVLVLFLRRK